MRATKIRWLAVQPTPYNNYLFRALTAVPDLDLQVFFSRSGLSSHPWKSQLGGGFNAQVRRARDWLTPDHLKQACDRSALFVIAGWSEGPARLISGIRGAINAPFVIWTDTPKLAAHRSLSKRIVRSAVVRMLFGRARFVMSTGRPGVEALREMGCPPAKVVNFPFFVDLDTFMPVHAAPSDVTFLSAGRLDVKIKGHDVALRALARARTTTGQDRFKYLIAGAGPDEPLLRGLVDELKLQRQVEFMGWVEIHELLRLLGQAHFLLHPSLEDPFPVAVLEAMAAGVAIMGSDATGAVRDRVVHGENGFVHRAGDVDQLADQLAAVLRDPSSSGPMGKAARATAELWPVERGIRIIRECIQGRVQAGT